MEGYAVRAGDTGVKIARMFNLGFKKLMEKNPEVDFSRLKVGQVLVIPKKPNPEH
jgi:LysM repeat protein